MPELAEVETVRRQVEKHLKGQTIAEIEFDGKDKIFFAFAAHAEVQRALAGAKILGAGRRGKYFWFKLDRKPWPLFHLGMSGGAMFLDPASKAKRAATLWDGVRLYSEHGDRERLWFCRLLLRTEDQREFGLRDPRRFGRMWLTDDPETHPRIAALGPDPLTELPTAKALGLLLAKRRRAIKTVLLDQAVFAGIGNYLADEILYQARIAPHRSAASLDVAEVKRLRAAVNSVIHLAVKLNANYERFPKNWLFHHRWGKKKNAKTAKGEKIEHQTVGGRTTAWVPGRQN